MENIQSQEAIQEISQYRTQPRTNRERRSCIVKRGGFFQVASPSPGSWRASGREGWFSMTLVRSSIGHSRPICAWRIRLHRGAHLQTANQCTVTGFWARTGYASNTSTSSEQRARHCPPFPLLGFAVRTIIRSPRRFGRDRNLPRVRLTSRRRQFNLSVYSNHRGTSGLDALLECVTDAGQSGHGTSDPCG